MMCLSSEVPATVEKTAGTIYRAAGRERPHALFGRLQAEKVGSLPPVFVVVPPLLLGFASAIALCFMGMRGHKVKTLVQDDLQGVIFTFFTGFPPLPHRKDQSDAEAGCRIERRAACRSHAGLRGFRCRRHVLLSRRGRGVRSVRLRIVPSRGSERSSLLRSETCTLPSPTPFES